MHTVIESPEFIEWSAKIWNDSERLEFIDWIASNALAGDVIPGSGSLRKVRWTRQGIGKRGGARVIYFNRLANGESCCCWFTPKPSLITCDLSFC